MVFFPLVLLCWVAFYVTVQYLLMALYLVSLPGWMAGFPGGWEPWGSSAVNLVLWLVLILLLMPTLLYYQSYLFIRLRRGSTPVGPGEFRIQTCLRPIRRGPPWKWPFGHKDIGALSVSSDEIRFLGKRYKLSLPTTDISAIAVRNRGFWNLVMRPWVWEVRLESAVLTPHTRLVITEMGAKVIML
ncbi:MAG: hypothetical protein WCP34_17005, partial [Pseudomonadota bacterium]